MIVETASELWKRANIGARVLLNSSQYRAKGDNVVRECFGCRRIDGEAFELCFSVSDHHGEVCYTAFKRVQLVDVGAPRCIAGFVV